VWCADSIPCPVSIRMLKQLRSPNHSASRFAIANLKGAVDLEDVRKFQEDQRMTTIAAQQTTTNPPPMRICSTAGCKNALSLNNTTGKCGECQGRGRSHSKKTNGVQHHRELHAVAAHPAKPKPNGSDNHRHDPAAHGNGNGNGARPAEEHIRSLDTTHVESSRVERLLAAIPAADKAKMLCAWIAGSL
jgi:hypothetical protein